MISGTGQNRKLGNLGNFIFSVIVTFKVLFQIVFYFEFVLIKNITRKVKTKKQNKNQKQEKHRNRGNFNPCFLMGYSNKTGTNLIILILIRKENLLKEI